ncbi:MAG: hypothetical protein Q4G58_02515 [bacterium]|nr:hypothetical protein [bacterium]
MKRQIQESYDQIHAPISLINDTKRLVHSSLENEPIRHPRHSRKPIYLAASMAACLTILITAGIHFLHNKPQATSPLTENQVNVAPGVTSEAKQFGTFKSVDEWKQYLSSIKKSGNASITLENDFILYETPIMLQGKMETIQIQIKQGKLSKQQEDYLLEGNYECVITDGPTILGRTQLALTSSSQFTKDSITVTQEDLDHDGTLEFALDHEATKIWYQISSDYKVIEYKK